jgi:hypothetical protein
MKHLLITTIAAVWCGQSQSPEPPTAKGPDVSIHDAVEKGNIEAVKYHLTAGTKVDAKNDVGWTHLQMAAGEGQKEIAELLIAKGADVNARDDVGRTPLDWAKQFFDDYTPEAKAEIKEIADLLCKHGGKTGEELKAEGK